MSYVVYHIESTRLLQTRSRKEDFATKRAAKAALTRADRKGEITDKDAYYIAEKGYFFEVIEHKVQRINLMSREPFKIGVNAHACVDPSTETYWSL